MDSTTNKEWMEVKYGNNKRKKIQRLCSDLKYVPSIDNFHSLNLNLININSHKQRDIVNGYINKIQQQLFPQSMIKYDFIKYLCFLYFHVVKLFQSKILSDDKDYESFINLLKYNKKNELIDLKRSEWKLLYRASDEGTFDKIICVEKIYNKPSILCLFEGIAGNICGGYTSKGWDAHKPAYRSPNYYDPDAEDDKAFIFSCKSNIKKWKPELSNIEWKGKALINSAYFKQYCLFGDNYALFLENDGYIYCNGPEYVYQPFSNKYQLLGGKHGEKIKEIEIYQIAFIDDDHDEEN